MKQLSTPMITNSIKEKLQCGAEDAKDWSRQNDMHITYDKTIYMILGTTNKQNVPQEFDIRIDDKHIKKTQIHKLLGIHNDDKLSWCSNIDHLCSSISSRISLLRQYQNMFQLTMKRVLSRIYSVLN